MAWLPVPASPPAAPPARPVPPPTGTRLEVAPGVHWIRMPLPYALDHINLWTIDEDGPGQVMVSLQAGGTRLLARITQHSARALQLQTGMPVFAQIKGMALLD